MTSTSGVSPRDWTVLLIGGPSGTGKSTVARHLARRHDADWLQVDDLRLALQWSDARLPSDAATAALRFFLDTPDVWRRPPEHLCDAMIATGRAMADAIAIVTGNHVAQRDRAVIEGDGILPSIVEHPEVQPLVEAGHVRVVFVAPASEDELVHAMVARGRGVPGKDEAELQRIAEMNWRYAAWQAREAAQRGIPLIPAQPWTTLADRIVDALQGRDEMAL